MAAIAAAWLLALVVVLRALGRAAFRAADEGSDRGLLAVRVLLIAFAVWGVAAVITLLVWIGVAAGIH